MSGPGAARQTYSRACPLPQPLPPIPHLPLSCRPPLHQQPPEGRSSGVRPEERPPHAGHHDSCPPSWASEAQSPVLSRPGFRALGALCVRAAPGGGLGLCFPSPSGPPPAPASGLTSEFRSRSRGVKLVRGPGRWFARLLPPGPARRPESLEEPEPAAGGDPAPCTPAAPAPGGRVSGECALWPPRGGRGAGRGVRGEAAVAVPPFLGFRAVGARSPHVPLSLAAVIP